jgi:hypothetical protein
MAMGGEMLSHSVNSLLIQLALRLPVLFLMAGGLIYSLISLRKHRPRYGLLSGAFALFLLEAILSLIFNTRLNHDSIDDSQLGLIVFTCLSGLILSLAWILLLVALFHKKYRFEGEQVIPAVVSDSPQASRGLVIAGYFGLGLVALLVSGIASLLVFDAMLPQLGIQSPGSGIGVMLAYAAGIPAWLATAILAPILAGALFKGHSARWLRIAFSFLVPVLVAIGITILVTWILSIS